VLEFLGRLDQQVKLRGFRVELGEIEHVLAQHAVVAQAVAVVREDTPGERRLVAYVVLRDAVAVSAAELRDHLRGHLPDYMVPSAVVFLKAVPLTPGRKVEYRALPSPDPSQPDGGTADAALRGSTEEILAGIWKEVLGLDCVGVHDNFFALGGHSLLAVRVWTQGAGTVAPVACKPGIRFAFWSVKKGSGCFAGSTRHLALPRREPCLRNALDIEPANWLTRRCNGQAPGVAVVTIGQGRKP
jgi:hypothetical protein